jgi:hypothetical protein
LAIACLCGSQQVAEYLLKELGKNYLSPNYEYMVDYVAASENATWAVVIARKLVEAGREMPEMLVTENETVLEILARVFQPAPASALARSRKVSEVKKQKPI